MPNQFSFRLVPDIFPVSSPCTSSFLPLFSLFCCWFGARGRQKGAGCHTATSCRDSSRARYPRAVRSHVPGGGPVSSRAVLQRDKSWDTHQAIPGGVQPLLQTSQPPRLSWGGGCHTLVRKFACLNKPKWGHSQTALDRCCSSANTAGFATSNLARKLPDDHSCRAASGGQGILLGWRD